MATCLYHDLYGPEPTLSVITPNGPILHMTKLQFQWNRWRGVKCYAYNPEHVTRGN